MGVLFGGELTTVVNFKKEPYDIYIGRPSKWGNPFTHKKEGTLGIYLVKTRKESIERYREWITSGEGMYLLDDLHELKGKRLGCFCNPKSCHGDILAELANKILI